MINSSLRYSQFHLYDIISIFRYSCMEANMVRKYRVLLDPNELGGYTVTVPLLPGCISEGDTREEALANIREAIELYIESLIDDDEIIPAG